MKIERTEGNIFNQSGGSVICYSCWHSNMRHNEIGSDGIYKIPIGFIDFKI